MALRSLSFALGILLAGLPAFAALEDELEYRATRSGVGLEAINPSHGLHVSFDATGIRIHDLGRPGSPELLALSPIGLGRGDALPPLAPGELMGEGARVEVRHPGLIEWYENSPAGLEHGFRLLAPPAGEGPLAIELALRGASASVAGDELILVAPAGRSLRYGKLVATDASGRRLAARLGVSSSRRVRIEVDDGLARYPLVIDPLLSGTTDAKLGASYGAFGASVSGHGDVNGDGYDDVVVGNWFYQTETGQHGAAYVYEGSAAGIPSGTIFSTALLGAPGSEFGYSVAMAGDVNGDGYDDVIVGAPNYQIPGTFGSSGAAFIFHGGPSGIATGNVTSASTKLVSSQMGSKFGISVAGAGDVNGDGYDDVIVGASLYSSGETYEGAAFVYLGGPGGIPDGGPLTAAARIEADDEGARLGVSVAGAGDVNGDGYDDVIVGASRLYVNQFQQGGALVLLGSASGIASATPATASGVLVPAQTVTLFGGSVAGAGDVNGDGYDDVIVGATAYDAGQTDEGAAFIFLGSASGIPSGFAEFNATRIESDQAYAGFGGAVAGVGDVDRDGFDDVVLGFGGYSNGQANEGAVFLFRGSASGVASGNLGAAAAFIQSNQAGAQFGASVAGVGDIDGDGGADVVIGVPGDIDHSGAVYLSSGIPGPLAIPVPTLAPAAVVALILLLGAAPLLRARAGIS